MTTETYECYKEKYGIGYIKLPYDLICEVTPYNVVFYKNINNGEFWHRLDGPAFIDHRGNKEWWINDWEVTIEIRQWAKDNDIDLENLSEYDISLIKLIWGNYGNI